MRGLGTNAVLAIAGLLGLLLFVYVFAAAGGHARDRAPHCQSQNALAQIKNELFRRAGELRGTTDPRFSDVQNYSVVRVQSRMLRRHQRRSGSVSCSGTIALDLPPGAVAVGGQSSLAGAVSYELQPQAGGTARLLNLSKADPIVAPLATVSLSNNQPSTAQPAVPPQLDQTTASPQARTGAPQPTQQRPQPPPQRPSRGATAPKRPSPRPAPAPAARSRQVSSPHAAAPTRSPALSPDTQAPRPAPRPPAAQPAPDAVATPKPSFNCDDAGTRGEIAVCRNPRLASLDRQMSAQFRSAVAAARPGQRLMLRNTGRRFLRYRDSCTSEVCIEDAYRGRMREINDIMTGGW